jgi:hypothetical protein
MWLSSGTVADSHRGALGVMPCTVTAISFSPLAGRGYSWKPFYLGFLFPLFSMRTVQEPMATADRLVGSWDCWNMLAWRREGLGWECWVG